MDWVKSKLGLYLAGKLSSTTRSATIEPSVNGAFYKLHRFPNIGGQSFWTTPMLCFESLAAAQAAGTDWIINGRI